MVGSGTALGSEPKREKRGSQMLGAHFPFLGVSALHGEGVLEKLCLD